MLKQVTLNENEARALTGLLADKRVIPVLSSKHKKTLQKIERALDKKPIKTASKKAKGRNLQKWAAEKIAGILNYKMPDEKDLQLVKSREMGQQGTDVVLRGFARERFPFAVECKAQEQLHIIQFIGQAKKNMTDDLPNWLLVIKNKSIKEPVIITDWNGIKALIGINKKA